VEDVAPRNARIAWLLAIAYAGLIFLLSSIPGRSLPAPPMFGADKIVHAVEFAVLAILIWHVARRCGFGLRAALIIAVVVAIGYGVLDELHQGFTPGRFPSIFDVVADAVGALLGVALVYWRSRR